MPHIKEEVESWHPSDASEASSPRVRLRPLKRKTIDSDFEDESFSDEEFKTMKIDESDNKSKRRKRTSGRDVDMNRVRQLRSKARAPATQKWHAVCGVLRFS